MGNPVIQAVRYLGLWGLAIDGDSNSVGYKSVQGPLISRRIIIRGMWTYHHYYHYCRWWFVSIVLSFVSLVLWFVGLSVLLIWSSSFIIVCIILMIQIYMYIYIDHILTGYTKYLNIYNMCKTTYYTYTCLHILTHIGHRFGHQSGPYRLYESSRPNSAATQNVFAFRIYFVFWEIRRNCKYTFIYI